VQGVRAEGEAEREARELSPDTGGARVGQPRRARAADFLYGAEIRKGRLESQASVRPAWRFRADGPGRAALLSDPGLPAAAARRRAIVRNPA
jgi:hypothetical protein